jgi:hypothetical protein
MCANALNCAHAYAGYANVLPTKMLFGFLFSDSEKGVKFLQDCGLLRTEIFCPNGNFQEIEVFEEIGELQEKGHNSSAYAGDKALAEVNTYCSVKCKSCVFSNSRCGS